MWCLLTQMLLHAGDQEAGEKFTKKSQKFTKKITKICKNSKTTAQKGAVFNKWNSDEKNVE